MTWTQSESRYERAMLASRAGHWEWNAVTDEYYVSPPMIEDLGFPPGTIFASRADFMRRAPFHSADAERYAALTRELFAGSGTRLAFEMRSHRNGETVWTNLDGICFRDPAGKLLRWTGTASDITERKRAEEALRESEMRYERAMLASRAGHWDWDVVNDDYYLSPRLLEMLALPSDFAISGREER